MKKKILFAAGTLVAVAAVAALILFWPLITMTPAETGKIAGTDITAIRSAQGCLYAIPSEDGYIMIDAGSDANSVAGALSAESIDPAEVAYVFLTHSDYDHVSALTQFPNAEIYLSASEQAVLGLPAGRNNSLPDGIDANDAVGLADGITLSLGGHSVIPIEAPGHTPGSTAYLLDGKYLFTGDAFRLDGGKPVLHPFTMDEAAAAASIEALAGVMKETELTLTSHYGVLAPQTPAE